MLCVDLIGLYHIPQGTGNNKTMAVLYCVTMTDPATGWFKIKGIMMRSFNVVANIIKQMWLTKYLWPQKVILDRGTKCTG
eukprot:15347307-Ditylum_brightwellii.AAC.1